MPLSHKQVVSLSQFSSVSQVELLLTRERGGEGDGEGPIHSILSGYFDPIFSYYQRIFQNIPFYIVRFAPFYPSLRYCRTEGGSMNDKGGRVAICGSNPLCGSKTYL